MYHNLFTADFFPFTFNLKFFFLFLVDVAVVFRFVFFIFIFDSFIQFLRSTHIFIWCIMHMYEFRISETGQYLCCSQFAPKLNKIHIKRANFSLLEWLYYNIKYSIWYHHVNRLFCAFDWRQNEYLHSGITRII